MHQRIQFLPNFRVEMKKWFAYSILFALTLLLVPRSWIHECDHEHLESDGLSADQDHCLVCELDMEVGTAVTLPTFNFERSIILKPVPQSIESRISPAFDHCNHRGPPTSC